jgi:broad specificity phosphatase PhoE
MLLYLIRHAESIFNAEGRIQGHANVPLSPLGRMQSEALAAALARLPVEAIYSSPLERARETAEPLARRLGREIRFEPRLIEINAGIFQGQRGDELDELFPEEMARWRSGDPDWTIPGGESRRDLMLRGRAAIDAILAEKHKLAVVVSHGGLISGAIKSLLEIPARRHPFVLENASISRLEIREGGVLKVLSLNQVDHLREVRLSGGGDL